MQTDKLIYRKTREDRQIEDIWSTKHMDNKTYGQQDIWTSRHMDNKTNGQTVGTK